jgi:hypothetical protein
MLIFAFCKDSELVSLCRVAVVCRAADKFEKSKQLLCGMVACVWDCCVTTHRNFHATRKVFVMVNVGETKLRRIVILYTNVLLVTF